MRSKPKNLSRMISTAILAFAVGLVSLSVLFGDSARAPSTIPIEPIEPIVPVIPIVPVEPIVPIEPIEPVVPIVVFRRITIDQSGSDAPVTATIDGSAYTLPVSLLWLNGSTHSVSVPYTINDPGTSGKRYVFKSWNGLSTPRLELPRSPSIPKTPPAKTKPYSISLTVLRDGTLTANYKTQYKLTINSGGHGSTTPTTGKWYDTGAGVTITMRSDTTSNTSDTRYLFTSWIGTGLGSYTGSENPCTVQMDAPVTETASWKIQYYLAVNSPHGTPGGAGWYDRDSTAYATLAEGIVGGGAGSRQVFLEWSGDASGVDYAQSAQITMDAPKTAVARWKTQYYLAVDTRPAGLDPKPTASPFGPWYDSGTHVTLTAEDVDEHEFQLWAVDGVNQSSLAESAFAKTVSLEMNRPHEAIAHYTDGAMPEFPSLLILPLFMVVTVLVAVAYRGKRLTIGKRRTA